MPAAAPPTAASTTSQAGTPRSMAATITKPPESEMRVKPTSSMYFGCQPGSCRRSLAQARPARQIMYSPSPVRPVKISLVATSRPASRPLLTRPQTPAWPAGNRRRRGTARTQVPAAGCRPAQPQSTRPPQWRERRSGRCAACVSSLAGRLQEPSPLCQQPRVQRRWPPDGGVWRSRPNRPGAGCPFLRGLSAGEPGSSRAAAETTGPAGHALIACPAAPRRAAGVLHPASTGHTPRLRTCGLSRRHGLIGRPLRSHKG